MLDYTYTTRDVLEKRRAEIQKRRRIIIFSSLGFIVLLITFLVLFQFTDVILGLSKDIQSISEGNDWAIFRRDLNRTGSAGDPGPVPGGTIKWTFKTGAAVHSSPAVVDGTVYIGSRDSNVYALDAATGEERWRFKTGSWVESSPSVVGGVVYVGSNDGRLYALDAASGNELWSFDTIYAVRSSPAVADGIVYIGSDDYSVYAVDAATGERVWSYETDSLVTSSPVVSNGIMVVGSSDGILYTFNAENGRVRLQFLGRSSVLSSPSVENETAYFINSSGFLYAVDTTARNWLFENRLRLFWQVFHVYGVLPRPPDPSGFIWSVPLFVGTSSSPALADGTIYVGAGTRLVALDAADGRQRWGFETGDIIFSSPAVSGGAAYVGSNDGNLYAIDRATGTELWHATTGDKITSSPAVANGMVFVGSEDGTIYAFE